MARGHLAFQRSSSGTAVSAAYAESPLKFLTPRNHGAAAWVYTSALGGGLVDGDSLRLHIDVEEGAVAYVSSQGPTRVFRSPRGCESTTSASLRAGAALVLLPEPCACFEKARFAQRTAVEMEGGASLVLWDVLSAGRERWAFGRCHSSLSVRRDGRALIDEAWLLDPAHGPLSQRLGGMGALGTLLIAGPLFAHSRERALAAVSAQSIARPARVVQAVSPLGKDGIVLRGAAPSVEELLSVLRAHLCDLPALLGDHPWRAHAPFAA